MAPTKLDQSDLAAHVARLHEGWTGSADKLHRKFAFADFPTAVEFVVRLAPRCEEMDHHPDLRIVWRNVDVELSTHSAGGVTELDTKLAGIVDEVAAGLPLAD